MRVVVLNCRNRAQVRPRKFIITCADANDYLVGLRWSSWGPTKAFGRGVEWVNACHPDCPREVLPVPRKRCVLAGPAAARPSSPAALHQAHRRARDPHSVAGISRCGKPWWPGHHLIGQSAPVAGRSRGGRGATDRGAVAGPRIVGIKARGIPPAFPASRPRTEYQMEHALIARSSLYAAGCAHDPFSC